ncbi:unnamed protein product [Somion occarium]|uniref:Uncharacterized protein n=1 Tax=Somion occarium TaxID=3059160 RepID=A0ABP1DAU3_9APHY
MRIEGYWCDRIPGFLRELHAPLTEITLSLDRVVVDPASLLEDFKETLTILESDVSTNPCWSESRTVTYPALRSLSFSLQSFFRTDVLISNYPNLQQLEARLDQTAIDDTSIQQWRDRNKSSQLDELCQWRNLRLIWGDAAALYCLAITGKVQYLYLNLWHPQDIEKVAEICQDSRPTFFALRSIDINICDIEMLTEIVVAAPYHAMTLGFSLNASQLVIEHYLWNIATCFKNRPLRVLQLSFGWLPASNEEYSPSWKTWVCDYILQYPIHSLVESLARQAPKLQEVYVTLDVLHIKREEGYRVSHNQHDVIVEQLASEAFKEMKEMEESEHPMERRWGDSMTESSLPSLL